MFQMADGELKHGESLCVTMTEYIRAGGTLAALTEFIASLAALAPALHAEAAAAEAAAEGETTDALAAAAAAAPAAAAAAPAAGAAAAAPAAAAAAAAAGAAAPAAAAPPALAAAALARRGGGARGGAHGGAAAAPAPPPAQVVDGLPMHTRVVDGVHALLSAARDPESMTRKELREQLQVWPWAGPLRSPCLAPS